MSLFIEGNIRRRAKKEMNRPINEHKSKFEVAMESASSFNSFKSYDIFLSHSFNDAELIIGIKAILEDHKYSVYIDWVDDPKLDRNNISKTTAATLKERMNASKSLFYVTTENSDLSRWMPWECGYFDGLKEKVAILPIKLISNSNKFVGQEYLGLYPYCLQAQALYGYLDLYIHKNEEYYTTYDQWVKKNNSDIIWSKNTDE